MIDVTPVIHKILFVALPAIIVIGGLQILLIRWAQKKKQTKQLAEETLKDEKRRAKREFRR
ncbi:MAG: hypothetical protein EAZ43_11705 [Betaproteobacteria bacterium]|nr:MAG: hypothetical protein EAZ43_11705 [Betaproteobacteria bacterium]